jgi:hypothetical protein
MAVYKVPQDVEAEDKLLGPFGFRQFIYMLIAFGLGAGAYFLFIYGGIFSLFGIVLILPAFFLVIISLPLRKEQPMETWVAALWRFWTKPKIRPWESEGDDVGKIQIDAPKVVEVRRTRNIMDSEAARRLSFLAQIVDTEGRAIKRSNLSDDILIETEEAPDMFDNYSFSLEYERQNKGNEDRRAEQALQLKRTVQQQETPEQQEQVVQIANQHVIKPTEAAGGSSNVEVAPDIISGEQFLSREGDENGQ